MQPDRDTLIHLYVDERKTVRQVADTFAVSYPTAWRWLGALGVRRRTTGEVMHRRAQDQRPPREELALIYERERRTMGEMAERYGVSRGTIRNWLTSYQIRSRPGGRGLQIRGITPPTAETLRTLIHSEHRSLRAVGETFEVDMGTVRSWLKLHAIEPPTVWGTRYGKNPPVLPGTDELARLYAEGLSLEEIGQRFGVSALPITHRLKAAGFEIRPDGFDGGKRFGCTDGHMVRSTYERRVDDWLSVHGVEHIYEPRLPWDWRSHADFMANGWYIEIWGVADNATYAARRTRKQARYRAHGAAVVEINHWDFSKQKHGRWQRLLSMITESSPPVSLL